MPESDLDLLTQAAERAGEIALRHWQSDHAIWDKPDGQGPVTEADLEIDTMLRETLTAARPDYGWLSEETADTGARLDRAQVFIVDPIDGTRAFMAGERTWAHSLAVVRGGVPTAAVVFLPARDKLYTAASGRGAWRDGQRMYASERLGIVGADVLAARPTFDAQNWPGGSPRVKRHFRTSLAYRMALVAEGRFDAMITLRDSWEWDIAAGTLLATEAGAAVSDRHGNPLRFNSPEAQTKGVLTGAKDLHADTLARLSDPTRD